ncbi:hypothetical protein [Halococcus sp. AFM35]|uniref:hypothetical protein n=1 Tax=Halococcus sp. AFM35 TaxID=3421653 RepID=UPI003EB820A1
MSDSADRQWVRIDEEIPKWGLVSRPLTTRRSQDFVVDTRGDDDNPGTESDPLATMQEAFNRLPIFVQHDTTIRVRPGTYTDEAPAIHTGPIVQKAQCTLEIVGDTDEPERVDVRSGINSTYQGKQVHYTIRGIAFDGLSQFAGPVDLRDCVFHGNGDAAISGKNGHVFAKRCRIGTESDRYAIWSTLMESYGLVNCHLAASEVAIKANGPGTHRLAANCTIDAPEPFDADSGSLITHGDELYVGGRRYTPA